MIQLSLNTPSAATNAPVYDGRIAAGASASAFAEAALLRGNAGIQKRC
jgi:predicted carbohydrate-binding protein with CBM5 and CBM33 domain